MEKPSPLNGLLEFLGSCPTPYHAVADLSKKLRNKGFTQLSESESWEKLPAGKYFISCQNASLAAFILTGTPLEQTGLRLAGAHTDSPCLKVKPHPVRVQNNALQFGVEVYGGALLNPWFDRDLSLAGRISWYDQEGAFRQNLIDFQIPVAVIPSLAIHLDREANSKRSINKQTDLVPLICLSEEKNSFDELLVRQLQKEYPGEKPGLILAHDLFFYDVQKPAQIGLHGDFITGARLDNLLSCYTLMDAMTSSAELQNSLVILNDHEEVGSVSASGAQGPFLQLLLERLVPEPDRRQQMLSRSLLISVDNAHAVHPNFADKHDPDHLPFLNEGPVLKWNANQRYATNAITGGFFQALCIRADLKIQDFVMRNDMACGSTIGPLTAAEVGVKTVDIGVPTLAMHSIRELAGSVDILSLHKVMHLFFTLTSEDPLWVGHAQ